MGRNNLFYIDSPSRIALKKVCSLSFCLFLKLIGFKNAVSFKISKRMHFSPFSVACYFLIDFSKILQITFPYSQSSLLRILRNREHGIEYISQNWWSKFHESSILILKFHKNIRKNTIARQARKIRPSNFQCYFLSVSCINGGNLKEFKIFDLTLNGWPAMECPFSYVSRGSIEFVILGTNALKINKVVFFSKWQIVTEYVGVYWISKLNFVEFL